MFMDCSQIKVTIDGAPQPTLRHEGGWFDDDMEEVFCVSGESIQSFISFNFTTSLDLYSYSLTGVSFSEIVSHFRDFRQTTAY